MTTHPMPSGEPAEELFTIAEVARILRVPVAILRYWRHLGTGQPDELQDRPRRPLPPQGSHTLVPRAGLQHRRCP
jgi:hypothetical protein